MTKNPTFVLLPTPQSDLANEFDLPDNDDNLFQRIIRNPHIEASNPKERECTEMLCGVLRNTTVLRSNLLRWMAGLVDVAIKHFDDLQFIIATEGAIGSKRDDLRIEGWLESDDDRQLILLWTVEVKVGASFHESTPLDGLDTTDEDANLVNQIRNYDHWLSDQTAQYRAGFVLALEDLSDSLPSNLGCRWKCLSWTALGVCLQDALTSGELPKDERFLTKHLLGFITNNLWRVSEMTEVELNFDDVAIIRAYTAVGRDCEDKINRLVEPLTSLVEEQGIGQGLIYHQKSLFKASKRSMVYRRLLDEAISEYPWIWAGIDGASMAIWLDTAPKNAQKVKIDSVLKSLLPELQARNQEWQVREGVWQVLELRRPLVNLLTAVDQASEFENFFSAALEDLRETQVIDRLREQLVG